MNAKRVRLRGEGLRAVTLVCALAACTTPTETPPLPRNAQVDGQVVTPAGVSGDAWLFLYKPGEGPPGRPAVPVFTTAVSAPRLATDAHYVFGDVRPNPWRLWGFLDVDGNFDPQIDVLAQPGAGDRVGKGVDLNVQPGRGASAEYPISTLVESEPPAFVIQGVVANEVIIDPSPMNPSPITMLSDTLAGRLDPARTAFTIGLVDADGDLRPDDVDGDMVPDLSLQLFLRWLPRPGQAPPGANIIVPLVIDPSPFLLVLQGRLDTVVTVKELQAFVVPTAQELGVDEHGQQTITPFGPMPVGDYELVVLVAGGQYWRMPNQLGPALSTQAVRLHVDRAAP